MAPPGSDEVLVALRAFMASAGLSALVVPSEDAHQSEYVPPCDARREFVSGFTGSAGTAVVTHDKALLWTDGRYFIQALKELGPSWSLVKALEKDVPTIERWLADNLDKGSVVGVNGSLLSLGQSRTWRAALDPAGLLLRALDADPVDPIWGADQPPPPRAPVRVHPMEYAGKSAAEKLADLRAKVRDKGAEALVVTALDEIAWLLNIRGGDVEFNPVSISYAVVTQSSATLFIDTAKLSPEVKQHLAEAGVAVRGYEELGAYLTSEPFRGNGGKVLVDPNQVSLAVANKLPPESVVEAPSPITLAKAVKNKAELEGMRRAHIRDGAALVSFLAWLERALNEGPGGDPSTRDGLPWPLTEHAIAERLEKFRAAQDNYVSLSFATISAQGANGSIIHYKPPEKGSAAVTRDTILLLDSGAQFLDGTTDVTRTVHFGDPTDEEKTAFTLVLKGHIALAAARFPEATLGSKLDILARLALWGHGLDYKHGTGHGVGAFLNVHEGPQSISYKKRPYEEGLYPGMCTSNEPGFYADGRFGIRIESIVVCIKADTPHRFSNTTYCEFETITMAPIQTSLVKACMLTQGEVQWLDKYHAQVRAALEPWVANDPLGLAYLRKTTEPLARQ